MSIKKIEEVYPELFDAIQTHYGLGNSKYFVDASPLRSPEVIMRDFYKESSGSEFDIEKFVNTNFVMPNEKVSQEPIRGRLPIRDYIDTMWALLERTDEDLVSNSSRLNLPYPYVVPGGRFREIYYWDSFFTMLGLAHAGRQNMVQHMVDNFVYLIDLVGFIPNGNRTYYCTRSQPPFLAVMVELLADAGASRQRTLVKYLPYMKKEYEFWMRGHESLAEDGQASARVVKSGNGFVNRYWDDIDSPRAEGYMEDLELAKVSKRKASEVYRDIRAAAESGWDFSARWFDDNQALSSIRTTDVIPIDLNSLMYNLELVIAEACRYAGDEQEQRAFEQKASIRQEIIQNLFFDRDKGFFCDLKLPNFQHGSVLSLAGVYPLYFNVALPDQAERVKDCLKNDFLRVGGWVSTLAETEQQWDTPNGWAPLQWMVYCGLINYGNTADAEDGARRWVNNNLRLYEEYGSLYEKYNVESLGEIAVGGEYDVQHGFGWTNAVLLVLMNELSID